MQAPTTPAQKHNPLHGLTLQAILGELLDYYGWPGLAEQIPLRCFFNEPSIQSSLKFLRKTPWARERVESLYLFMQREIAQERAGSTDQALLALMERAAPLSASHQNRRRR
jgi:uncharacterized protein (DUF2132 family)